MRIPATQAGMDRSMKLIGIRIPGTNDNAKIEAAIRISQDLAGSGHGD